MPPTSRVSVPPLDLDADAPTTTASAAVDVLVAPTPTTEDDALDALLDSVEHDPSVTAEDRDDFSRLAGLQRAKRDAEATAKSLVSPIRELTAELLDRALERGWSTLPATVDARGEPLRPYRVSRIYPKYRTDPDADARFTAADVYEALAPAGLGHLRQAGYDSHAFTAYVAGAVKAWRIEAGDSGAFNADGHPVDSYGCELTEAEAHNPVADILALHPAIREVVEPSEVTTIGFSRG